MFDVYCKIIIPYMYLYKHLVEYYEKTVYEILEKDIGMILPKFEDREKNIKQKRQKRQIILALISGFIGLAYEAISSFYSINEKKHYSRLCIQWIEEQV